MNQNLKEIIWAIDDQLGEGYAKKNPELIAQMYASNALITATHILCTTIRSVNGDDTVH